MLPYKNLIIIDKTSHIAVFKQIAVQFIGLIQKGKLLPGTKLPSTRALAYDLGLHRKTIMAAYDSLVSEDWIDSLPRKGYIVSPNLPFVKPRSYNSNGLSAYENEPGFIFDSLSSYINPSSPSKKHELIIDDGLPDTSLLSPGIMLAGYRKALDYPTLKKISTGWDLEGSLDFRNSLCHFLNQTRGIDITTENLLTARGAQMAIYLSASLIIKPGDKVIVSDPSYFFANMIFERFGAELIYVPVDHDGMCTEVLEELLKKHSVKLLYVIPHHHHPTTVTMSTARRNELLILIKKYQIAVIEDDYDYDFQFEYAPYLPLASGDHEGNIIYIGSLTKVLGAPFRLGYIVAAKKFIRSAAKQRLLIDLRGDVFTEQVVSGLIENGELTKLIQKANKLYRHRCHFAAELFAKQLGGIVQLTKPNGGMALWLQFKNDFPLAKVIANAKGLKIIGSVYSKERNSNFNAFRFGFASLNDEEIIKAIDILKTTIHK
ncbi:aminotransferase-like domain-containing protein [Epilithonimonas hungarica]|uniref:Transcriptional regulator, GntR family n=1 Tax=Epilithonimonas hungarica TaxID=454006 RepID=A0A1G7SQK1_9FLAO|nr:PLP-dependent aminotransferase family protein [Epilithonimonas hungarica]SDG25248.1 transcriptional regulator, GntR family [Epilithonimonas hungarica]